MKRVESKKVCSHRHVAGRIAVIGLVMACVSQTAVRGSAEAQADSESAPVTENDPAAAAGQRLRDMARAETEARNRLKEFEASYGATNTACKAILGEIADLEQQIAQRREKLQALYKQSVGWQQRKAALDAAGAAVSNARDAILKVMRERIRSRQVSPQSAAPGPGVERTGRGRAPEGDEAATPGTTTDEPGVDQ